MGLGVSHGCWRGAYSAFHRWRIEIARAAGLPALELMEGFWTTAYANSGLALSIRVDLDTLRRYVEREHPNAYHPDHHPGPGISLKEFLAGFEPIRWDVLRPDPLHILLRHSDCDGAIAAADCGAIADRLEELLPRLPRTPDHGHIGDWTAKTQAFIDGLRRAAQLGEDIEFS